MVKMPDEMPMDDSDKSPVKVMTAQVCMQNGRSTSLELAVEVITLLDHLARSEPELLRRVREACLKSRPVQASGKELIELSIGGICSETGEIFPEVSPIVLASVRGMLTRETVENPFVDEKSRSILDHLRFGITMSMLCDPLETKAIHENPTVVDLNEAPIASTWVGYVEKGKEKPTTGYTPPSPSDN